MAQHNNTGRLGEAMSVEYLSGKGFRVLHRNWRHSRWEVDILAEKDGILHFIEVKTRRTKKFGNPEDSVDKKKIQNLINAAEEYLYQHPEWKRIQFDVLSVSLIKDEPVVYFLIEDVYL